MQYALAFKYFVDRPGGFMNLLLVTVCLLIPAIGPIIILGYQAEVAERLVRDPEMRDHPKFTFDRFVEYLTRGIWPFLVQLLVSVVAMVVIGPAMLLFVVFAMMDQPEAGAAIVAVLVLVGMLISVLLAWPWVLHAELTKGFDFRGGWAFVRDFWRILGARAYVSILVFWLISWVVALAGLLLCFVGVYPAAALIHMAAQHIMVQHYTQYLDGGGRPLDHVVPEDMPQEGEVDWPGQY